jgi:hypothetical protein
VDRGTYAGKLTLAGYRQATIERSGLDKGSFHIRLALFGTSPDDTINDGYADLAAGA